MATATSIVLALLSLWASSLSAARVRPTAKESSSLESLRGEWYYNGGMSKYELIIDDNDRIIFKSNTAEGALQQVGAWWQGMLANGMIRLQPDSSGNIVSEFKASSEDGFGDRITARKKTKMRKQKMKGEKVANLSLSMNESDVEPKKFQQCPYKYRYDTEGDKMKGGEMSFECHKMSIGQGNKCPALQQARLKTVKKFGEATYNKYLTAAKTFPLKPLFDKTMKVSGSENYEEMVHMHVEGLMHKDVKYVEDKIMLKALATKLEIPATKMYFGAHRDDWDKAKFKRMLGDLCLRGVDEFIIKAVHLAWSAGQKIVRGWQQDCPWEESTNAKVEELATFVDEEIMNALASEADAHLREFVTPGVTVEELFKTGGESKRPLEAKVQVVWGKVHHMFFVGEGPRGCKVYPGAWSILGDKTGWDLKGMIGAPGGNDEISDAVLEHAFDGLVKHSESFAKEVGADVMRVDFFIGFDGDEPVTYKLNEAESVSGARYWHERDQIGRAWVDGYILADRINMSPAKWDKFVEKAENSRRENHLD